MARWHDVEESDRGFAVEVRARLDAHKHKLLATLRKDGAPRISGVETVLADGDLWLGMMPGSRKVEDLRRDPRFALHTSSVDPPEHDPSGWSGDAKLSGRAIEERDPDVRAHVLAEAGGGGGDPAEVPLFRLDIDMVVLTRVGDPPDHLLIQMWRPGQPLHAVRRT